MRAVCAFFSRRFSKFALLQLNHLWSQSFFGRSSRSKHDGIFPKQPSNIHSQSEPNSQLRSIKLIKSELKYVFGVREWMRDDVRSRQKKICIFSQYRRGKNWLYNPELRTTAVAKLNSTILQIIYTGDDDNYRSSFVRYFFPALLSELGSIHIGESTINENVLHWKLFFYFTKMKNSKPCNYSRVSERRKKIVFRLSC